MRRSVFYGLVLSSFILWSCAGFPGGYVNQPPPEEVRTEPARLPSGGAGPAEDGAATTAKTVSPEPPRDPVPSPPPPEKSVTAVTAGVTEAGKPPAAVKAGVTEARKPPAPSPPVSRKPVPLPPPSPPAVEYPPEFGTIKEYTIESEAIGEAELVEASRKQSRLAQKSIDEVLLLLNQSRELWEKGDLDGALDILDQAYALTFGVNDGPEITWQKDDLRFLIAKRIVEIYASRSTVAVGLQSEIPLSTAEEVEFEIRRFQNQERTFFLRSYRRSGAYRPMIVERLREAGLPEELSWLPLVESGFNVKAFSSARALGLWQFIPSTGYKFGLKRDPFVDERMDPERSTLAAIAYLTELHGIFGDWQTVLAAYNCGEGRVLRVISGQQMSYLDNFWDLYRRLPDETRRYVPRFLATVRIIKDPEKYGFDLANEPLDEPWGYETVTTTKSMRLADIARHIAADEKTLELLNAELRLKVTPSRDYDLKVPPGQASTLLAALESIPGAPRTVVPQTESLVRHQVRSGESLSAIAARYGSSADAIAKANNLARQNLIRAGQWLRIPVAGGQQRAAAPSSPPAQHRVQRGESLSVIAARYGLSVNAIAQTNHLSPNHLIREGQVLALPGSAKRAAAEAAMPPVTVISYTVKERDSLFHLARRFKTTVSQIQRINNLNSNLITVGQVLRIPAEGQALSPSEPVRYVVQGGDSPSTIAKKFNISVDQLLKLNDLSRKGVIHPGQTLTVQQ
jgi:membrane-bound lytic murein transglycosylase D